MQLDDYVTSVRDDLAATAALGADETRRAAELLATALGPSLRLTLMRALSDLAAVVSDALGDTTVAVTIQGDAVRITTSDHADAPGGSDSAERGHRLVDDDPLTESGVADSLDEFGRAVRTAGEELSRTTLRLVDRVKSQAEHAAATQGISLNTYIQQAIADSLRTASRRARREARRD